MIDIKDEESDTSMSLDLARVFDYCCKNNLSFEFCENSIHVYKSFKESQVMTINFTDLHFPKNLLRALKERIEVKNEVYC